MFYSIKIFAENLQVIKIVATFAPALRDKLSKMKSYQQ